MRENKGISQSEAEARVQREAALRKEAKDDAKKAKEAADSKVCLTRERERWAVGVI